MRPLLLIAIFLFHSRLCPAQNSLTFISATTGAACQEVESYGDYLITGNGTTLAIYDVRPSQTVPFEQVFQYRYRSRINDLQIRDHFLYVAANHDGVFKWDISDIENPKLAAENHDGTFCHRIKFSADGNYIFAAYSTGAGLRVFETATLAQIDSLNELVGAGKMLVWQDRIFIKQKLLFGKEQLNIINVADPFSVAIERSEKMKINDMAIENGKLYLVNDDAVLIYDISEHGFEQIFSQDLPSSERAKLIAVNRDTIFVCRENGSIAELVRYLLQPSGSTFSLTEDDAIELAEGMGIPQALAADEFGCYLAFTKVGLVAQDKSFNGDFGYYQTGLDFKGYNDKFGVTSLFCKNGYIFLCEYFAQTSILANHDIFTDFQVYCFAVKERFQFFEE